MTKTKIQISTPRRSLVKALVFRLISIIVHFVVIYAFTGEIAESILLTAILNIISTIIYYIDERVWTRISWGRKKRSANCDFKTRENLFNFHEKE